MLSFRFVIGVICFMSITVNSQEINQFDNDNKRHGVWRKTFKGTNQVRYEGQFEHGRETGEFKFYKLYKNKSVLSATKLFHDKTSQVAVKFYTSRGKLISEGSMIGKIHIGKWIYYHKNSSKIMTSETYDNRGLLQGDQLVYYDNGVLAEKTYFLNGKKEGVSEVFSLKGVVLKHLNYANDTLHGLSKSYNGKGELLSEGQFKKGKKTGVWLYYNNKKLINKKDFTYYSKFQKPKK